LISDVPIAVLGGGVAIALGAVAYRQYRRSRITPEELERKRREKINAMGKMGDATLVEIHDDTLVYAYDVRGVTYTASQDIRALRSFLPADFTTAAGPVNVKYDPRNPANSILLCEQWSGLRLATPRN
jgi:phage tail tape-measure protein